MGAFQTGFQVGSNIAREALARKDREEQIKREEEDRKQAREMRELQMQDIRDRRDRDKQATDLNTQALDALMPGMQPSAAPAAVPAPAMTPAPPTAAAQALQGVGAPAAMPPAPAQPSPVATAIEAATAAPAQAAAPTQAPTYSPEARALALRIRAAAQAGKETTALMSELRTQMDTDFEREQFASYTGARDQVGAALGQINKTSPRITASAPDKRGFVRLSVVDPSKDDGEATFLKLSKADQAKVWAGAQMMQRNPRRGLEIIGEVNRTLAAAVAADNNLTTTLASNANDLVDKGLRADLSRSQMAEVGERMNSAKTARSDATALRTASVAMEKADQAGDAAAMRQARLGVLGAGGTLPKRDDAVANDIRDAFKAAIKPDQFGRSPTPEVINATMAAGYGENWRDLMMGRSAVQAAPSATASTPAARAAASRAPMDMITMADIQATADRNKQPIATVIDNVAKTYSVTPAQLMQQLRRPAAAAPQAPARQPTSQELADDFARIR
jgi:hypothetical protein